MVAVDQGHYIPLQEGVELLVPMGREYMLHELSILMLLDLFQQVLKQSRSISGSP